VLLSSLIVARLLTHHPGLQVAVRDQDDGLRRQVCAVTARNASPAARAMVRALEDEVRAPG
jgi:hypothetical protein